MAAGLYAPTFFVLYRSRWEAVDYTHAYFILPVALYLVWRLRHKLPALIATPSAWGCFLSLSSLLLGLCLFILGWKHDYLFLEVLSLIPVLLGLTCYLYGRRVLLAVLFPILYLVFLIPPPFGVLDEITLPMRHGVSVATELFLKTAGYPVSREGLLLFIGRHEVRMEAACSGFRSLITLASLGSAYIYMSKTRLWSKIGMSVAIVPLALLGNLVRVIGLCLATYYLGPGRQLQLFHDVTGFLMFAVLIAGLFGVEALCERRKKADG